MARFSPDMLKPALASANNSTARTAKEVALSNIEKQKHLFNTPEDDGKRTFKVSPDGKTIEFTIRVSNTALILAQHQEGGATADIKEMSIPKANFVEALDWYAERIKVGEFDSQLDALNMQKEARTNKLRETRAAKKEPTPA